jgi:putative transposase
MTAYRRARISGATWFFTVNLAERRNNRLLVENVDGLRETMRKVKAEHPFDIDAIVILPDHIHCIWTLPQGDTDYSTRWALIKAGFSRGIASGEWRSESRRKRGERGIWQRRFWEHLIRDDLDYQRHVDYIHWNPIKHGWVRRVADWEYSSFRAFVECGVYPLDWACEPDEAIDAGE